MIDVKSMSLELLYAARDALSASSDPSAPVALRVLDTEIRMRRRLIREDAADQFVRMVEIECDTPPSPRR